MRIEDTIHGQDYPKSYYADFRRDRGSFAHLDGDMKTPVAIVGGGFTGVVTALCLAEKGIDCVLLEQNEIGWGASGRNGGQVIHGFGGADLTSIPDMGSTFGSHQIDTIFEMALESVYTLKSFVHTYDIDCDLKWGYVDAAMTKAQYKHLLEGLEVLHRKGYAHHTYAVDQDRVHEVVGGGRFVGATVDMGSGHVQPLDLVRGEARVAERLGAKIHERALVTSLSETGKGVQLVTDTGTVTADTVILGGNAYLRDLVPELARKIMPVASFITATDPLTDAEVAQTLPQDMAVCDCRYVLDYFRLSADKRLLYGGMANYSGASPADVKGVMAKRLGQTFPLLSSKQISHAWGGHIGISRDRLPLVGRIGSRIYYAQGYSGHGVAPTHLMGKLLSEAVAGQMERFDVFAHLKKPDFPGGPFKREALVLGMLYYRLRDLVGW